ncbi:type II toxin-antitoxin system RelE family toxin [Cellulomonas sp. Marseille-Q8402]
MRAGGHLPDDQAELTFSDRFAEQLEDLTPRERVEVLAEVVGLCAAPDGSHTLSARGRDRSLVGWNTLEVSNRERRVVYRVDEAGGSIFVLCLGPRRGAEVYDLATALTSSGALSREEATQLWDALGLFDVLAEELGLDGWDYTPPPAPVGLQRAAVAAGVLEEAFAALLSRDEVTAAMEQGWGPEGPDPALALRAALRRARGNAGFDSAEWVVRRRADDRCAAPMPRAGVRCIRRAGHPGPHRARP